MIRPLLLITAILALGGWSSQVDPGGDVTYSDPEVVEVQMIERGPAQWRFAPDRIQVAPGTVVRFVLADIVPHNVEFKDLPEGTDLGDAKMGPFLIQRGQTYDVVIDERFAMGEYHYVCTPHEMLGMVGVIEVVDGDPAHDR